MKKLLSGKNDFETIFPELAKEWDYGQNDKKPSEYVFNSTEEVFWICSKGHDSYLRRISERAKGKGCKKCARLAAVEARRASIIARKGSLKALYPELAAEWDYVHNLKGPECYTESSGEEVSWICSWCHQPWRAVISSRTKSNSGCPHCHFRSKTSFPEQAVFYYVSKAFSDAENSFSEPFLDGMELDIYIPSIKTGIEYDGVHWHQNNRKGKDLQKYIFCKQQGIQLIRIRESDEDASLICDEYIIRKDYSSFESLDMAIAVLLKKLGYLQIQDIGINTEKDCNIIRSRYYASLKTNSLSFKHPEIAAEWHPTKNGNVTPDMISPGTNVKYWWVCSVCGKEYHKSVSDRVRGIGCKVCSSRKKAQWAHTRNLKTGINDLKTLRPDLVQEWDHSKNPGIIPEECTLGSEEPIIWKCKICGTMWPASINARVHGSGCPKCGRIKAGESQKQGSIEKYGSLKDAYPEIAAQWDYKKNAGKTPADYSPVDKTPGFHWICSRCRKPFSSSIYNLTHSRFIGCTKCRYEQTGEERQENPEMSPFYGKHHSEEAKKKISIANSGANNSQYGKKGPLAPNYGVTFSDEHRKRISQALKGRKKTEETKAKLSAAKKGKRNTSKAKPVRQLTIDGEEVQRFESIKDAEIALGISAQRSHIGAVCRGVTKSAYGFKWEYIEKDSTK